MAMVALMVMLAGPRMAAAQTLAGDDPDRDLRVVVGEPDFTLVALPTTLRLPKGKTAFRITHRFTYQINDGSFGDFFKNGLGFDSSATTGFEFRYGLAPGTQVLVHRTGARNIQFMGQHQLIEQEQGGRFTLDVLAAIEGQENFSEEFSLVGGAVLSHRLANDRGAVYAEPIVVLNAVPQAPASDENTLVLGLGARIRLRQSRTYVVGEVAPRLLGYDGNASAISLGVERRAGGHMFQLNLSNSFGTTLTQVGQGGPKVGVCAAVIDGPCKLKRHWHLGFNLTRRFF
jgi:hypothetical protein